jgi:S-DNA-T family DNA segregation ATPase FtsK/SpoIIIE
MPDDAIEIAAPPNGGRSFGGLGQAVLPVLGSLGIVAFAIVEPSKLFLIMAAAFVGLALLTTIITQISQRRSGKRSARSERRLYRAHLAERRGRLEHAHVRQREIDERLYPEPARLAGLATHRRHLWERRPGDADFLCFRLGEATIPLACGVELERSDNPLTEYRPELLEEAEALVAEFRAIDDMSVVQPLDQASTITLGGERERIVGLVRTLIAQAVTFRAPGDLRVMASFDRAVEPDWGWLKWLPHNRAGGRSGAEGAPSLLLAQDRPELERLLELHLQPRVEQLRRIESAGLDSATQPEVDAPELLLVLDGFHAGGEIARLPLVRELMAHGRDLKVRTLCIVDPGDAEPPEAQIRILAPAGEPAVLERTGPDGMRIGPIRLDALTAANADILARELAPLQLDENAGGIDLAAEVKLADVLADTDGQLCAPIGLSETGDRLVLDLKQAAEGGMGPHGLIVGATGSGKSELLRTIVASLASAHPPDELCFVFVDFKGGAAFAELARVPHAAGMITNLQHDLTLIDRAYQALYGEIERRQSILRDAGNLDDITEYRARRRSGAPLEPLPHLLMIVDEFGELLANRPEFIELFLAIGRVGRSLGIHLLLSSQRLEEGRLRGLEGHLRYRICLRTYSASESKAVLGRGDAFLLPPFPGVGYLNVDTDIFQRFKTALVTTPHVEDGDRRSAFVGSFGLADAALKSAAPDEPVAPGATELDVLVDRLRAAHGEHGGVHQVWLAPLPERLALSRVLVGPSWRERRSEPAPGGLEATLGLLDRPAQQRQEPFGIDLSGGRGHLALVGASQTGKSTALRTLLMTLLETYTPDELRAYALDFGGGGLRPFADAPHVGGVATKSDHERVRSTVRQVRALIEDRAAAFRERSIDSMSDARAAGRSGRLPADLAADVLLVVDGWGALLREHEDLTDDLTEIAAGGLQHGVHLIVTAGRWAELRPAIRESFGSRLELRLNDPMESDLGRRIAETLPVGVPGRGITPDGLHFQIALPRLDDRDEHEDLGRRLQRFSEELAAHWRGESTWAVRVLPERVELGELPTLLTGGIAIGVEEQSLSPVALDLAGSDQHLLVLGDPESGRTQALRTVAHGLARRFSAREARLAVVDFRRGLSDIGELGLPCRLVTRPPQIEELLRELREVTVERLRALDQAPAGTGASGPEIYVLVDDYDLIGTGAMSPLAGLGDLILQGRDAGIHVVLARSAGGAGRSLMMDPVLARLVESGAPALLLSGDPHEGPLVRGVRAESLPPGRGRLLRRRGRPALVQLAVSERRSAEPEPADEHVSDTKESAPWHASR